jgi:hypothetical protein
MMWLTWLFLQPIASAPCTAVVPTALTPIALGRPTQVASIQDRWDSVAASYEPLEPPTQVRRGFTGRTYSLAGLRWRLESVVVAANRRYGEVTLQVCNFSTRAIGLQAFNARVTDPSGALLPSYQGWFNASDLKVKKTLAAGEQALLTTRVDFVAEGSLGNQVRESALGRLWVFSGRIGYWFDLTRVNN